MPPSRVPSRVGLLLAALLTLGACGTSGGGGAASPVAPSTSAASSSSAPSTSAPSTSAPSTSAPSTPASPSAGDGSAAYCSALKANGASASDFGAIPTFYPKAQLLDDVQGKLEVMGDVSPPAEISDAWDTQQSTLEKVEAAAKKLPAGGRISDPGLVSNRKAEKAEDTLTKYWFAHCR